MDYARALVLDKASLQSEMVRVQRAVERRQRNRKAAGPFVPDPGVSVVVATHSGRTRINGLLESLATQTIEPSRFEVVIVENGEPDGTSGVIEKAAEQFPWLRVRYVWRPHASAGGARNLGIQLARMSRLTFVDDDDRLEPRFLEDALSVSTGNNIVVSPIVDVTVDGARDEANSLNQRIAAMRGKSSQISELPWLLGFNACKLVPTWMVRNEVYREDLRSGEDLVFWSQLLKRDGLTAVVAPAVTNNAYLRGRRPDSVSRRTMSREFYVTERIACISALGEIKETLRSEGARTCVDALARAQAGFISRFLTAFPDLKESVIDEIQVSAVAIFPWESINSGEARDLAFVYCFAPYADTSAVVAAKAIAERKRIVDVVANDMASVRKLDPAASALADRWIAQRFVVDSLPSFAGWPSISNFAVSALEIAEEQCATQGEYVTLYSRALWVGSHVAAILYKLRHPDVFWTAEFSDPLRFDAEGNPRPGSIVSDSVSDELLESVQRVGLDLNEHVSLFELVEIATFLLADELVFTNQQQKNVMLASSDIAPIRQEVSAKAIVRQHPTPNPSAYFADPASYVVPSGAINIGYFGNFYPNRGISEILLALANSSEDVRRRIRLHVFSNATDQVANAARDYGVGANVYSNEYLPYMKFLNATTKFDALLALDVVRNARMETNPFLPSKVSDYRGSGRSIWAVVDEGSPMSQMSFDYVSKVGDVPSSVRALRSICGLN